MTAMHRATHTLRRTACRLGHAATLWAYGMSITVLLLGLWGRAVASDASVVEDAASEAAGAAVVSDRVVGWVLDLAGDELPEIPDGLEPALAQVLADPAARGLVASIVDDVVAAALAPPGSTATVDVGGHLREALPAVREAASRLGAPEAVDVLERAAASMPPIRLETGNGSPAGAGISAAGTALRTVVVVAGAAAAVAGASALLLSPERRSTGRQLAVRAGLSGIGFAVMMRLGSWALDPGGGGASAGPSMRRAGAIVLGSGLQWPLLLGLAGLGAWALLRRRWRGGTAHGTESPAPPAAGRRDS